MTTANKLKPFRRHCKRVEMTADDQYVFQRTSTREERAYRLADQDDAHVALLRLKRGGVGVVACVTAGIWAMIGGAL